MRRAEGMGEEGTGGAGNEVPVGGFSTERVEFSRIGGVIRKRGGGETLQGSKEETDVHSIAGKDA